MSLVYICNILNICTGDYDSWYMSISMTRWMQRDRSEGGCVCIGVSRPCQMMIGRVWNMRDPFQNDQTVSFVTIIWGHVRLTPSISYLFNWLLFRYSYYRKRHNDWPKVHGRLKKNIATLCQLSAKQIYTIWPSTLPRVAGKVDLLATANISPQKTIVYLAMQLENWATARPVWMNSSNSCPVNCRSRAEPRPGFDRTEVVGYGQSTRDTC